jgi:hypothetical protein
MGYKYKTLKDFRINHPKEYGQLYSLGMVENLCVDMGWSYLNPHSRLTSIKKPRGYWTKEHCLEEALKHNTRKEWQLKSSAAYRSARVNGWYDECTAHMIQTSKPNGYWKNKEHCLEEALKYNTRKEWNKNSGSSYNAASLYGWLTECTKHMVDFQKPKGYWSLEKCLEEALKHGSKNEWLKHHSASYQASKINGWFDECIIHMFEISKPSGYWTKERCLEEALKYKSRTEWLKSNSSSYAKACKNDWVEECTAHMTQTSKPNGYWTKEHCLEEALKYNTRTEWMKNSGSSYGASRINGWHDECTAHMIEILKPSGYWNNKERCLEEALKYNTRTEWMKNSDSSHHAAERNGWVEECTKHMVEIYKPKNYWTKEKCIEEALKYNTRNEWKKSNSSSYTKAGKNGWYDECTIHMINR